MIHTTLTPATGATPSFTTTPHPGVSNFSLPQGAGADLHKEALAQLKQEGSGAAEGSQRLLDAMGRARATGKRKTSVAQVLLWQGQGCIMVNQQPFDAYFRDLVMREHLLKPLILTGALGKVDIAIQVKGRAAGTALLTGLASG
jgi:hypothetical protein